MAHQFKVGDRVRFNAKAQDGGRGLPWFAKYFGLVLVVKDFEFGAPVVTTETGDLLKWEHSDEVYPGGINPDWLEPAPPAPALIDPAKTYQTRDGRAVRIYAVDGGGENPVHGAIERENGEWVMDSWTATGAWLEDEQDSDDLIEVKPEHTVWANVYPGDIASYPTKEDADRAAYADRIACIRVTYRAGDGL